MTSFALVIWAYEQSGSALSTVGVLVLLSTDALCVWCVSAVLGWLSIPLMNANLDVLFRTHIPVKMQGRVYAARNSLQFFTIPLGYLLGGALVDTVFEPFMAAQTPEGLFCCLFGTGKAPARVFVPCPRLPRRRRFPLLPPQQAYPRAGSERQRLKS